MSAMSDRDSMPVDRPPEDRREGVRVDDRVLLEYWLVTDVGHTTNTFRRFAQIPLPISPETGESLRLDPLVVQWMSKIEWTLDAILHTLEHQSPRPSAARLMDVNVSGDGVRFLPERPLAEGDMIDLRMVLPPFIVVEARGEVMQMRPKAECLDPSHTVVVRFTDIAEEDREKIIRYVVQRQAELQRRHQRSVR
jgi:hypothetical protein